MLSLFSVESLDARLAEGKKKSVQESAGPKRWNTVEFYVYGAVFAIAVPLMFKAAIDASWNEQNYDKFSDLLQPGFFGIVDNSDDQYSGFRDNFLYLFAVVLVHFGLKQLVVKSGVVDKTNFNIVFGILFLCGIHGTSVIKIMIIYGINYYISRLDNVWLTWGFNMAILFANELADGYRFAWIGIPCLDEYPGIMSRWDVTFNFSMLRMVSFNIDYSKALMNGLSDKESKEPATEKERIDFNLPVGRYNFINYLSYVVYSPLYLAGPILTFNDFIRQCDKPLLSINPRRTMVYGTRFLFCLFTMEFILHATNVVAISKTRAWEGDTPFQISMIALFNLCVIWLKLLLIWRFFRLWALVDEIDPPENMLRCVCNNYSALSFWRSWHRSYNRWVVRYIYIPLGGSSRPIINNLIVFTFVAVWHDIKLYLLFWGWLVVVFIIPELAATAIFKPFRNHPMYRHLCAIGAVANIWMMMIANLIGFCVHLDGMKQMLNDMVYTADGLKYMIISTLCLFVGAQAMFEFRETEKRKGINLRC